MVHSSSSAELRGRENATPRHPSRRDVGAADSSGRQICTVWADGVVGVPQSLKSQGKVEQQQDARKARGAQSWWGTTRVPRPHRVLRESREGTETAQKGGGVLADPHQHGRAPNRTERLPICLIRSQGSSRYTGLEPLSTVGSLGSHALSNLLLCHPPKKAVLMPWQKQGCPSLTTPSSQPGRKGRMTCVGLAGHLQMPQEALPRS